MDNIVQYATLIQIVFSVFLVPLFWLIYLIVKFTYKLTLNDKIQDRRIADLEERCKLCPT